MFDVITIGSAIVDVFIQSEKFQSTSAKSGRRFVVEGDKIEIESLKVVTGGGGSNCATGFSRLGFKTGVIAELGKDNFSRIVLHELRQEGVGTEILVQEKKEETGGSVLLVDKSGERTALVHRAASSMLDPHDISPYWLSQAKWVHLSSVSGQLLTLQKIFEVVKKYPDTKLSWNPGKKELKLLVEGKIEIKDISALILFVNEYEWEMLRPLQEALIQEIPQIVVTKGKEGGVVYLHGKKELRFFGSGTEAIDVTGAGDSFAVGYVAAQILNKSPRVSIEWGVRNAGSVVRFFGAKAGLLTRNQITNQEQRPL